jgi:hypothetical protein
MRKVSFIIAAVLMATWSYAGASIISSTAMDDEDGALECVATWDGTAGEDFAGTMSIDGVQYWRPGHINGTVITDTELDPTIKIINSIDNDTTFVWTDYHINVSMDRHSRFLPRPAGRATGQLPLPSRRWLEASMSAPSISTWTMPVLPRLASAAPSTTATS